MRQGTHRMEEIMEKIDSVLYKLWKGVLTLFLSVLGIAGWLLKALLTVLTLSCIAGICAGIFWITAGK